MQDLTWQWAVHLTLLPTHTDPAALAVAKLGFPLKYFYQYRLAGELRTQHLCKTYFCFIFSSTEIQLCSSNSWQQKGIFDILSAMLMQSICVRHRLRIYPTHFITHLPEESSARSALVCSLKGLVMAWSSCTRCQDLDVGCLPVAKATQQRKVKNMNFRMSPLAQLCSS